MIILDLFLEVCKENDIEPHKLLSVEFNLPIPPDLHEMQAMGRIISGQEPAHTCAGGTSDKCHRIRERLTSPSSGQATNNFLLTHHTLSLPLWGSVGCLSKPTRAFLRTVSGVVHSMHQLRPIFCQEEV